MTKYKVSKESNEYVICKVEIDRETDKSVFIGKHWFSNKNYFDDLESAKVYLNESYTYDLRNTPNSFVIVEDSGLCGFELYDNESKKMQPCGDRGCVVTNGKYLCVDHFESVIGAGKEWSMFNLNEEVVITINRFLMEIDEALVSSCEDDL